jgi:hypothetical protein
MDLCDVFPGTREAIPEASVSAGRPALPARLRGIVAFNASHWV